MYRTCVLRIEGTNCEEETKLALGRVGIEAELTHLKQLLGEAEPRRSLFDFDALVLPGGWSAGDYVRAGAILAARLRGTLFKELRDFVKEGRAVVGICNGFQVLLELGLLPATREFGKVEASLLSNSSGGFECRHVYIKHLSSCCKLTRNLRVGKILEMPVAHAEGRFSTEREVMASILDQGQVVFKYCKPDGEEARGEFPWNPNGSLEDIAALTNPEGNVLGLMPHPERIVDPLQHVDWTRKGRERGDGLLIFEGIFDYLRTL